jgi:hypothetical protein
VPATAQSLLDLRIKHARIASMMEEVDTLIYPGSQDNLLLICGPTGVGKSTLSEHVVKQAIAHSREDMEANAGIIPAVYVEAPASGEHEFSWRLFYTRMLAQLDPITTNTATPRAAFGIDADSGRMVRPQRSSGTSLAALRGAVERALAARKTQFIVVDEAVHIIQQSSASRLETQLNTLKSLANNAGPQIVLVGSYDLYQLMSLSGQLARRSSVLHFERYRQDRPEDLRSFGACVQKIQNTLPHLWGDKLMPHVEALQENTLGCVGTLCAVLTRTAVRMERRHVPLDEALCSSLLTDAQRNRILEEIVDGEAAINPGLIRSFPKTVHKRAPLGRRTA